MIFLPPSPSASAWRLVVSPLQRLIFPQRSTDPGHSQHTTTMQPLLWRFRSQKPHDIPPFISICMTPCCVPLHRLTSLQWSTDPITSLINRYFQILIPLFHSKEITPCNHFSGGQRPYFGHFFSQRFKVSPCKWPGQPYSKNSFQIHNPFQWSCFWGLEKPATD